MQAVQKGHPARPREAWRLRRIFTVRRKETRPRTPLAAFFNNLLSASHGAHYEKRLNPRRNLIGQRGIRRFVGQILRAGEESYKRSALKRHMVADRSPQHRIACFE